MMHKMTTYALVFCLKRLEGPFGTTVVLRPLIEGPTDRLP